MIQIKEFLDHREDGIENDVNTWIEENNVDVVDIKFSTSIWPVDVEYGWHPEHSVSCIVIYKVLEDKK